MVSGIMTALATPFINGKIDLFSLKKLLQKQVESKVSGVVLFGSTGEGGNIEPDEYSEIILYAHNILKNTNVSFFVGSSSTSTARIIKLAQTAKQNGASGVLVSPTPYNKPTQEGIFDIYKSLSDANIPFIAYNIPGRAVVNISDDNILKIAALPGFLGLKDSTGDLNRIIKLNKINVVCGDDYMFLANIIHGASGIISVASNIIPKTMVKMHNLCKNNNYKEAAEIFNSVYPLFCSLFCQSNPIPVKFALNYLGIFESDELRSPLINLKDDNLIETLKKDITDAINIENLW